MLVQTLKEIADDRLASLKALIKDRQEAGIIGLPGNDPVAEILYRAVEIQAKQLANLPSPTEEGSKDRFWKPFQFSFKTSEYDRVLKFVISNIESAENIINVTQSKRGLKGKTLASLITKMELPNGNGPINEDKYYAEIYGLLMSTAQKTLDACNSFSDNFAEIRNPRLSRAKANMKSNFALLKQLSGAVRTKLFETILNRLSSAPFLADEYEEIIRQTAVVVDAMRSLGLSMTLLDSSQIATEIACLYTSTDALYESLEEIIASQDCRLRNFKARYMVSGRSKAEVEEVGAKYTPDAIVSMFISKFDMPSVEIQHDQSFAGKGGYAAVYKDRLSDGKQVAVKFFSNKVKAEQKRLRLLREATVFHTIQRAGGSERTVELVGFVENYLGSPEPCLVTAWCNGENLARYLDGQESLSRSLKLRLVLDVAEGLKFLHNLATQIVHGDLKSENVLVKDGRAVLCDFGLSRVMDGIEEKRTEGESTTRLYDAPEMVTIPKLVVSYTNCMTDMYSLGSVFLEVMLGVPPFHWLKSDEIMHQQGVTPFENPPPSAPPRNEAATKVVLAGGKTSDEAHPKVQKICQEHWEFMRLCWSRNPWKRPTAFDAVHRLSGFLFA